MVRMLSNRSTQTARSFEFPACIFQSKNREKMIDQPKGRAVSLRDYQPSVYCCKDLSAFRTAIFKRWTPNLRRVSNVSVNTPLLSSNITFILDMAQTTALIHIIVIHLPRYARATARLSSRCLVDSRTK